MEQREGPPPAEADGDRAVRELVDYVGSIDVDSEKGPTQIKALEDQIAVVRARFELESFRVMKQRALRDQRHVEGTRAASPGATADYDTEQKAYSDALDSAMEREEELQLEVAKTEKNIKISRRLSMPGGKQQGLSPYVAASVTIGDLIGRIVEQDKERGTANPYENVYRYATGIKDAVTNKSAQQK